MVQSRAPTPLLHLGAAPPCRQALPGGAAVTPPCAPLPFPEGISALRIGSGGPCAPLPPPHQLPAPPVHPYPLPGTSLGRAGGAGGPASGDRGSLAQGSGRPCQPRGSQEVFLLPILPERFRLLFPAFIPFPVGTGPVYFPGMGTPWGWGPPRCHIPTGHSNTPNANVPWWLIGTHPAGAGHPGFRRAPGKGDPRAMGGMAGARPTACQLFSTAGEQGARPFLGAALPLAPSLSPPGAGKCRLCSPRVGHGSSINRGQGSAR